MPFLQVDDETLARLKELHELRKHGAVGLKFWSLLDSALVGLLGPMEKRLRCKTCGDDGRIGLGTSLTMACPVCGEGE